MKRNLPRFTAPNQLARGFASRKWPQLEAACARFIGMEAGETPPAPRQPAKEQAKAAAMAALQSAAWQVKREVVLVWSSQGDELILEALESLARNDEEWRVRAAVADTLATIGSQKAVELLTSIIKSDPHPDPKEKALRGLEGLALAPRPLIRSAVRARGAVRTRGASSSQPISPEAEAILDLFDRVITGR